MEEMEKLMELVLQPNGKDPIFNCMLTIRCGDGEVKFSKALGTIGKNGDSIKVDHRFRVGSITKLFTATIILQMIEEGIISLGDFYLNILPESIKRLLSEVHIYKNKNYSKNISIENLLHHTSGLRDNFSNDERFINFVLEYPLHPWTWELVMDKYFEFGLNKDQAFTPGSDYHYSDINYLLLAILIENIYQKPLHQTFRDKIIAPLSLSDTYLEFFESPKIIKPIVYPYYGTQSLENINTSFDWGSGGLISTLSNLDIFITNLIKGNLFQNPEVSLQHLFKIVQKRENEAYLFFGQKSAYGSMLFYDPLKDTCIAFSLNQTKSLIKTEWLWKKIASKINTNNFNKVVSNNLH
jgi:D-alanyl-D-alanine carboxypeptidase